MEEDAYNVELAAPVLMESELERPNAIAVDARRLAPLNAGFAIMVVSSLFMYVCCEGRGARGIGETHVS